MTEIEVAKLELQLMKIEASKREKQITILEREADIKRIEVSIEEFEKDIVLADEKAMSIRTSPFRNVESLTSYIESLLEE